MSLHDDVQASLHRILRTSKDPDRVERAHLALRRLAPEGEPGLEQVRFRGKDLPFVHLMGREGVTLCAATKYTGGKGQENFTTDVEAATCWACLRALYRSAMAEARHLLGATGPACGAKTGGTVPDALPVKGYPGATCISCLKAEIEALREQRDEKLTGVVHLPATGVSGLPRCGVEGGTVGGIREATCVACLRDWGLQ